MKTEEQIKDEIARIKQDARLEYPPANVFVNAPLALIQVELKARLSALQWVAAQHAHPAESATASRKNNKKK